MRDLDNMLQKEMQQKRWVRTVTAIGLTVFLILSMVFCVYVYVSTRTTVRGQAIRNLTNICQLNEDSLTRAFQNREKLLQMISNRLSRKGIYEVDDILDELEDSANAYECYQMGVLDPSMTLYRSNGEAVNVAGMEELTDLIWDTKPHITSSYFPSNQNEYMVNLFSCPVFEGDELRCVLVATYYSRDLTSRMNINSLQGKGYTFLLDQEGHSVITPQQYEDQSYVDLMHYLDGASEITPSEDTDLYFTYEGEKYYARCEKLQVNDWYLMTCAREADVFAEARVITRSAFRVLHLMWIFILCAVLVALYANYRFRKELRQSHYYDSLLGIGNVNALEVYFQRAAKSELGKRYLSVMDVDKFKEFNYIYGNEKGDELLRYIVRTFQEELPEVGLFRRSDDCFVILDSCRDEEELKQNIKKTQDRFARDIASGVIPPFDTSAGNRKVDPDVPMHQLISDAMFARDMVKGDHLRHSAFYDNSLRELRLRYMEMESSFDAALERREFHVYYQPKYDMATGTIVGAEALTRWIRPDGSLISPALFVPCFESSHQICKLDEYVLGRVCSDLREWRDQGLSVKPVSVNLSRIHLMQADLFQRISGIIKASGIQPKWLSFEITESALSAADIPLRTITDQLRTLGCRVEMDDYGVGASSPKALASNCFDVVKLDKSFVDEIGNGQVEAVIQTTIQLARRLGLDVIAEGVEEQQQVRRLLDLGCSRAQGFFYSKPLPEKEYTALLATKAKKTVPVVLERTDEHISHQGFSEEFCLALDSIAQPIHIMDPETFEIIYSNTEMCRFLGKTGIGMPCYKAVRGLDSPCENCAAVKLYEEGISETHEHISIDGRSVLVHASPIQWRGRQVYAIVGLDVSEHKRLENELNLRSQEYEAIVQQSMAGVIRYDLTTGNAYVNMNANFDQVEEYMIPDYLHSFRDANFIDSDSIATMSAMFDDIHAGIPSRGYDVQMHPRTGDPRWCRMNYSFIRDEAGKAYRAVISFFDNTEQHEKELAFQRWNDRLNAIMGDYPAYMEVNLSQDVIEAEGRYGTWENSSSGRRFSQALDMMANMGVLAEDRSRFRAFFNREQLLGQFLAGRTDHVLEYRAMMEGALLWYKAEIQMVSDPASGDVKASILVSNVDDLTRHQQDLKDAAERDAMTGLYNHAVTETLIRQIMGMPTGERCCLLIIDLDNLRMINSDLGHPEGDRALKAIADCMRARFRKIDIMGRMGGDEFVALLRDVPEMEALNHLLAAFLQCLNATMIGPENDHPVHASVGAAMGTAGEDSFETLYHQADLALFYVKAMGKNSYHVYEPELEKREFHYKPQSSATLNNLESLEAGEIKKLLYALSAYSPMVISVNLTRNTYYMMEYESYMMQDHPDEGCFDQLIEDGVRSFHPDDRESFLRCFKRENLLAAFERGERMVQHRGRQKGDDGIYRLTDTAICMMQDERTGDVCEIVLSFVRNEPLSEESNL